LRSEPGRIITAYRENGLQTLGYSAALWRRRKDLGGLEVAILTHMVAIVVLYVALPVFI
jgi:hypothetical protein